MPRLVVFGRQQSGVRYLCIDLGDKRTGLAAGDAQTGVVAPVGVIETPANVQGGEALLRDVERAVREHLGDDPARSPGVLVVGLPLNMDGTEGPRSKVVRAFATRLAERTGREVRLHDERLSTAEADWSMARSGLTRGQKKARRDALAAAAILRDFLAQERAAAGAALPDADPTDDLDDPAPPG